MKEYCENPLCQNKAAKEVIVSVEKPSDRTRALCATCEEAYSWGVQQGRMAIHHAGEQSWKAVPYNDRTKLANPFAVATIVDDNGDIIADVFSQEAAALIETAPELKRRLSEYEGD